MKKASAMGGFSKSVGLAWLCELACAEVERAFNGGVFIAIRSVNGVGCDAFREVRTDGTGSSFSWVGRSDQLAEVSHCVVLFKNGSNNGTAGHVLGQFAVEWTLSVYSVEGLSILNAELRPLHRFDGEARFDDAVDDLSSVTGACGVRLDHGESTVCGHGVCLNCGAKVLSNSLFAGRTRKSDCQITLCISEGRAYRIFAA